MTYFQVFLLGKKGGERRDSLRCVEADVGDGVIVRCFEHGHVVLGDGVCCRDVCKNVYGEERGQSVEVVFLGLKLEKRWE